MSSEPPPDIAETVALATAALGAPLTVPAPLGGSRRSLVLRCRTDGGSTVVLKRFLDGSDGGDGYVRERAGLGTLDATPDLLATDDAHHLLVMSDLGQAPTLADALLGADPHAAHDAAVGWAAALGELLAGARPHVDDVEGRLAAGGAEPWDAERAVRSGTGRLLALLGEDATPSDALEADLAAMRGELRADPAARVVSPGDTCPDNALRTPSGWRFLDLEGTSVHHVALDAAYALLPFPSCWCVFDPPPGLTDAMLAAFTEALAPAMPDVVGDAGWAASVDRACGAWVLAANAWLADAAVADRASVNPTARAAPSFRALLTARWRWGAHRLAPVLPAAAELLARAAAWADDAWGRDLAALPAYPAFRGAGPGRRRAGVRA